MLPYSSGSKYLSATLILVATLFSLPLSAQDTTGVGGIRGTVTDPQGSALSDVQVCLAGLDRCVRSDAEGRFRFSDIRAGEYQFELTLPGTTATRSEMVRVRAGLEGTIDIALDPVASNSLDTLRQSITVTESAFVAPEEVKTSNFLVTQREVFQAAGALQDVSRYVQSLPGVAIGSNDFRNDIIVRGGSPLENLFIVDNIEIPNINAFATFASAGGTVSILDANLLQDVSFLTGGYPAPYINRVSSVLQITQREGDRNKLRGQVTSGFAGGGVVLEGPVNKGKGSWVASARRSFLDLFTDDIGFGGVPVVYTFNTKFVYDFSPKDRIWIANLSGADNIRIGPTRGSTFGENDTDGPNEVDVRFRGWRSATGFNWQHVFGTRGVGLLGVTHSEASTDVSVRDLVRFQIPDPGQPVDELVEATPVVFGDNSREGETTLKYDYTGFMAGSDKVQFGGSYKVFNIRYNSQQPFGDINPFSPIVGNNPFVLDERETATQSGAYLQTSKNLTSRLNLTLGGRVDNYQILGQTRFSPRAGLSYRISDKLSWRASYGQYYQQPFFFFVTVFPVNRGTVPFRADHYVTGFSYEISPTLRVTLEGYAKDYKDYPTSLEFPTLTLANIGDTFDVSSLLFPITSAGRGRVRGVELFIEKKYRDRWFGQANLSFSQTRHAALDNVFRPGAFDYPVIANFVGGYRLTKKWEFSTRVSYLSGRPFTPFNEELSREQRRGIFDLDRVNAERADDYFRFDIRLDRTFTVRDKPLLVFLGVQNLTNRRNFAQVQWDRVNNEPKIGEQLGLFPLIGLDWRF